MKFQPTIDVHSVSTEALKSLQPGQWVSAGKVTKPEHRGVFCGVKPSGTVVVAWMGNARGRYKTYRRALMDYAKGGKA